MNTRFVALGAVALAALGAAVIPTSGAFAQSETAVSSFARDRNISVRARSRPDFDALGVRAGSFLVFPKAELSEAYEDNVFASQVSPKPDWVTSFAPSITAQSQWSRHALNAAFKLDTFQYAKFHAENNTTYSGDLSGRLDVVTGTNLTGGVSYAHLVEPRSDASSPAAARDPVEYNQTGFDIGASREVNRIRVSADAHYRNYTFSNVRAISGGIINEKYRNNNSWEESLRADYALSPALAVYGVVYHNDWSFHAPVTSGDVLRDASGEQFAIGSDFEVTRLVRGQIQVGYLTERFRDQRVPNATGLALLGRVEYFPTELLTLTVNGERSVQATGVVGSAGYLHSAFGAQADYELLRNLILTARAQYASDDYRGFDRTDHIWTATLGANYLVNRKLGLNLLYNYYDQNSVGAVRGLKFSINRIQLGLVLQY